MSPAEMAEVDRLSPEPVEVLVGRAASAVARVAVDILGQTYGKRVVVVAGPGNNGWDGRVAADILTGRGVSTRVIAASEAPDVLPACDLVIDAAFGTGFRGEYRFPDTRAPVLAVDIPSGLDGSTGAGSGTFPEAVATVTFAALKPGLIFGEGPGASGRVQLVDIGLDVSSASMHLVTDADVRAWVPARGTDSHKWRHAVWVVAGSPGMTGAAALASAACMRGGAGYVRLSSPGVESPVAPLEVVLQPVPSRGWARSVVEGSGRFAAIAVGPGIGRAANSAEEIAELVEHLGRPLVLDGDALWAMAQLGERGFDLTSGRAEPTVLTPHDGEYELLMGEPPAMDRVEAARILAARSGSTVLLKGPTTVVADPDGQALIVLAGDQRLATAGTGDVLTGLVAAHLASQRPSRLVSGASDRNPGSGLAPEGVARKAAAAAAHLHGVAASLGPKRGMVASDLVALIPAAWESITNA